MGLVYWWNGTDWDLGAQPVPDCPGPPVPGGIIFCGPNSWWISAAGVEGQTLVSHGADAPTWASIFPAADLDVPWQTPNLLNSWVNSGPGYDPVGYRKLANGTVELKGLPKGGKVNQPIFVLPPDCCPYAQIPRSVLAGNGGARVDVTKTGSVAVQWYIGSGSNANVSLAGYTFAIAPTFVGTCRLSGVGALIGAH
jgi:hypothetical protein